MATNGGSGQVDLEALVKVADEAADAAGAILLEFFGRAKVEYKGEIDLVTNADRAAEEAVIEIIRRAFPDHAIYGEESGEHASDSDVRWLIDPIDGTTNYAHGLPIFAVSIAAAVAGEIQVGIVYNPYYREKYTAVRGRGARLNGEPIRVSRTQALDKSMLVTGFPYSVREELDNLDHFTHFTKRGRAVRRLGSAALDLAFVARGAIDGYWEPHLHPYDLAAGWLLVEEAGGRVTDLRGNRLRLDRATQILATNGAIHQQMLEVLRLGKTGMEPR